MQGLNGCRSSIVKDMKKITLAITFACAVFNAYGCSCRMNNAEEVAHRSDMVLTKLKISTPSITERVRSLVPSTSLSRTYAIEVIENYKGTYTSKSISANTNIGIGGCGREVFYGDTINIISRIDDKGITSDGVSVCNMVSDEFAEKVKQEIKNPNKAYDSVNTSSWTQFHKTSTQTFFADTKNVTKDEYGSYIWILMNDKTQKVKSEKTKLHFACKEKMFTVDHQISFSDFNANGKVLNASNFGRVEQYEWLPLTDVYSKLLKYTC